jgi:molybdenum cofactor cytidylyltransferase
MTTRAGAPVTLVLAAGKSARLGPNKLLEPLDGKPMIERTLDVFLKAEKTQDIVVVVGPGEKERYAWLKSLRVHLAENPDPERGMISSIRVGLGSAWSLEKDFLIHPADVPFVKSTLVDRLIRELRTRGCDILLPAYQGLGGHPGIYAARLRSEFFLRGEQAGAREVIQRHRQSTVRLNVPDPDICFDVDTPDDLRVAMDPGARWARVEQEVEQRRSAGPR